ncbi:MAG: glucose 1-dehydrogenase [Chloroflexota bacterium]|nr:glucose 1-dehydrogenase [Chloroflexota bacterium]
MNLFDLSGKTALVTGGNGGIGYGIAEGLAQAGADIVIGARNKAKTSDAVGSLRELGVKANGIEVDVADEASIINMVKEAVDLAGRVDILVNNAGIGIRKLPQEYQLEDCNKVLDINLTGSFLCAREFHSHMKENGGGKIINIGSMTSIFGLDWAVAYASSKGGVVQLTKTLAVSWAQDNIQVNTILPGWIHTDLTRGIREDFPDRYTHILSRIPDGRWGEPADLAGTSVFLASQASNYVTGISIPVDGGYTSF